MLLVVGSAESLRPPGEALISTIYQVPGIRLVVVTSGEVVEKLPTSAKTIMCRVYRFAAVRKNIAMMTWGTYMDR